MYDFKKYLILVVDDEERALNSFKYSFEDDFNIIFAQSAAEAEKILNDRASEISVILSDHKMPNGLSGLDFLKKCAITHPDIIKILTTAYSNQDLAIDAVNSGAIYQYIVKPWEMENLFQILLRGYELFILHKEKKFLETERINMLEKLIFTDRIRNLATLSEILPLNNSVFALKKFIKTLPPNLLSDKQDTIESLKNLMNSAKQKNRRFLEIIRDIKKIIVKQQDNFINYSLENLLREEEAKILEETNIDVKIEIDKKLPELKGEINIMRRLIRFLFKHLRDVNRKPLIITADSVLTNKALEGVILYFPSDFIKNKEKLWELLPIFFAVHHHSGKINVKKTQVEIFLPISPDSIIKDEIEDTELLNVFFDQFEVIKHYEAWLSAI